MSRIPSLVLLGGGIAAVGTGFIAYSRSQKTVAAVKNAVAQGGSFNVHATGYWPSSASAAERQMEGKNEDRKGKPLHTLEQHQADPSAHPYVSVSGDDAVFPYGQRLSIDEWPGLVFRVVDTGGRFRGAKKLYRIEGREPLDICVNSSKTKVIANTTAHIVAGDNFEKGKAVSTSGIRDQSVAGDAGFMIGLMNIVPGSETPFNTHAVSGLVGLDIFCGG